VARPKLGLGLHRRAVLAGRATRRTAERVLPALPLDERPLREKLALSGTEPVSRRFGFERGRPIDRVYIEAFLEAQAADVRGRVLEIAEPTYTERYGGDRVTRSDVLHASDPTTSNLVGDLQTGEGIPQGVYDCFICTQTFQVIPDLEAAIRGAHDILAPGGVLLATLPGMSQASVVDRDQWGDWHRFTVQGAARDFGAVFGEAGVTASGHGNVLACAAFLYGWSAEDVGPADLRVRDDEYDLLVTVRAVRGA
jgi:SAM-dependent methyltransferase